MQREIKQTVVFVELKDIIYGAIGLYKNPWHVLTDRLRQSPGVSQIVAPKI